MTDRAARRSLRLGGCLFAGAALLAAAALGLDWRYAPAILRVAGVQVALLGVGILALFLALLVLVLDPLPRAWAPPPPMPRTARAAPSLMVLPAIAAPTPAPSPPGPSPSPAMPVPTVAPSGALVGTVASSTLLIPFGDGPAAPPASVEPGPASRTVSGLVDRIDALQRVTPPSVRAPETPAPVPDPSQITLLQRLTQIPSPRGAPIPVASSRRCVDCGEPLGSPPRFEPCGDCGRALCARCYWRTSSGPQAHLCASCLRDRSVPRPAGPAVTFGRPTAVVGPTVSPRTGPARRPVN